MKFGKIVACALAAFTACTCAAAMWWVDDDWYNQGGDGTEARPFGTIQDALDNPLFADGDTVKVKAGVYNKGGREVAAFGGSGALNRVVITNQVRIVAVDGREKTFIVGAAAPDGDANGMGSGATRCILHHRGANGAFYNGKPAIVEGFTICGGRTASGDTDSKHYAGGVLDAPVNESQGRYSIWLVDCTISNCVAGAGGATRFGSLYRCLVADCGASYRVAAVHASRLHSCIVAYSSENSASYGLAHGATAVNCTFFMNRRRMTNTTAYNCVFANDAGITDEPSVGTCTSTAADGIYQLFAPALGDWRLKSGVRAIGLGTVANLSKVSVPDEAKPNGVLVDYAGNPYSATGAIAAGAVQGFATPAGGALYFNNCMSGFSVDGKATYSGAYMYPESYPTQYHVRINASASAPLFCIARKTEDGGRIHPQMDDYFWMMPPPDVSYVSTNTGYFAQAVLWCDANSGDDANAGTENAPFKSIQKAVDAAVASTYTVIYAAAGDYNTGADGTPGKIHADTHPLTNRVYIASNKQVFIRGAGAGKSFITGAVDPTTGGTGTGAVRPVTSMSATTAVQGFTLRGSGAYGTDTGPTYMTTGAFSGQPGTHLLDCTVTGNSASGAVVFNAKVERCLIVGNSTRNYVVSGNSSVYNPVVSSVVADNCDTSYNVAVGYSSCYNVTARSKATLTQLAFHNPSVTSFASLADTCRWAVQADDADRHAGLLAWNLQNSVVPSGSTYADPLFCSADAAEYRVAPGSPAYTCGVVPSSSNYGADYWKYAHGDINGNRLVFTDGKPMAGACHTTAVADLYVDGTNGNDANDGTTPAAAKKTIAAALATGIPSGAAGATVHVAAGTYDSETPQETSTSARCKSRVVVPTGVTLEGAGADVTEIVGATAPSPDGDGLGDGAVRCVYLMPGATVRGFTLRGGHTAYTGTATADASNDNNLGGGVLGSSAALATVEDCVITNCTACRGGGAAKVTLRRCRVLGCKGTGFTTKASASLECSHFNTVIDNCSVYAVCYPKVLENCTLGAGNSGNNGVYLIGQAHCRIVNTIFLGGICIKDGGYNPDMNTPTTNCIFAVENKGNYADYLGPGSRLVTDPSSLAFGDGYMPVIGSNVAVDAADATIYTDGGDKDAFGRQRVYNNALDIGAVEADWRAKYATDLSTRRYFEVTAASPGVVETGSGAVQLAAGETFAAQWNGNNARRQYAVTLNLAADSAVTVTVNGVSTTYDTAGRHELRFDGAANPQGAFQIACTSGTADILAADAFIGMTIIFR